MTTTKNKIYKTLTGLNGFRWVDKGRLLTYERENGEPCISQDLPEYFVNMRTLDREWIPGVDEKSHVTQYHNEFVNPTLDLWNQIGKFDTQVFSENELATCTGSDTAFVEVCRTLRKEDKIREIAEYMSFPHAGMIDRSWFVFRFIQSFAFQFLVLRRRYPDTASSWSRTRMEHDLHDMDYLALGLHVGGLATFDASQKMSKASLAWRFSLLEPSFDLIKT